MYQFPYRTWNFQQLMGRFAINLLLAKPCDDTERGKLFQASITPYLRSFLNLEGIELFSQLFVKKPFLSGEVLAYNGPISNILGYVDARELLDWENELSLIDGWILGDPSINPTRLALLILQKSEAARKELKGWRP